MTGRDWFIAVALCTLVAAFVASVIVLQGTSAG